MNEMPIVIVKLVRRLAAVVIAASVLAGLQAAQAAGSTDQAVGALAYAPQTETLYRSDGQALYRSDSSGNQWRSEEHTSELQSLMRISYAVFCLKKKKKIKHITKN